MTYKIFKTYQKKIVRITRSFCKKKPRNRKYNQIKHTRWSELSNAKELITLVVLFGIPLPNLLHETDY